MAEAALFSLAGKILGEIASPAFKKAFERVQSIRKAKEDLDTLCRTIQMIQFVLLDAEKKHQESAAVREWIQRVRDVLYDADDLFDAVATDALLMQQQPQKKETKLFKVQTSISKKLSAFKSDGNIAKQVKTIKKRLDEISKDITRFQFLQSPCENQNNSLRSRSETRPFVDEKVVIGRDEEKQAILEFLFDELDVEQSVSVIAIIGIGGMGKTTLAQLVYNNEQVQNSFENRWWACISDIVGETNVLERIALSINKKFPYGSDPRELISRSVSTGGRYLLVLDDVWDNDLGIWFEIMSLLCSSGGKGSKIIVTTRFLSVPRALLKDKCRIYELKELSENKSWELFKKIAFTEEQENDQKWTGLGRKIMHKCVNVPLAIKSIASLLLEKNTIQEWESFKDQELSRIEIRGDSIMSTLKLSYDHLPSHLKQCFAYCSLFPQDYTYDKEDLILQWIAQGYVKPNDNETFEETGHVYFMELFRKNFFQEEKDEWGKIDGYKMHDLIHDLAKDSAGTENLVLISKIKGFHKNTLHLWLGCREDIRQSLQQTLQDGNQLRSFIVNRRPWYLISSVSLEPLLTELKLLRTLDLSSQTIENVSSSIGGLKHLRYLNLSWNKFTFLPDSLTKLVNLLTLNVSHCRELEALPNEFRKLMSLRNLYDTGCENLKHMPPGLGELTCLQRLDCFKVGRKTDCSSRLDALSAGFRLKGQMAIEFDTDIDDWDEDERWELPTTLQKLTIMDYPGRSIPHWERGTCNLLPNIVSLHLNRSSTIKHLPPLRCLPYLKILQLVDLHELEYVEEEGGQSDPSNGPFFPCLEELVLDGLLKLKGWSMKLDVSPYYAFPLLSEVVIWHGDELKAMPLCPHLRKLNAFSIREELMQQLMTSASSSTTSATVSHFLVDLSIHGCDWLRSFCGETFPSLRSLSLGWCHNLKSLYSMPLHLEMLEVFECKKLELWEEYVHERGVDWDSLPNLCELVTKGMGGLPEKLPLSLQQLQQLGQLRIWR